MKDEARSLTQGLFHVHIHVHVSPANNDPERRSPLFDPGDKVRVAEATDLVKLVGESVVLKKKGKDYVCLCPFHNDRNPSMGVSPTKQIYKCWSCGAGVTAIRG